MDLKPVPEELQLLADAPSPYRVRKIFWRGKTLWVKKATGDKSTAWHVSQRVLSFLLPLETLKSTVSKGGAEALLHETVRIEEFRKARFVVPEVVGLSERWLILEDMGTVIDTEIKTTPDMTPEKLSAIGKECAVAIASLHKAGLCHGRCKLNDLVRLPDGRIGFIDFEENAANIPLKARQAREFWLFSTSLARYLPMQQDLLKDAVAAYLQIHTDPAMLAELKKLLNFLRPFVAALSPFRKIMRGDAARAHDATRELLLLAKNRL